MDGDKNIIGFQAKLDEAWDDLDPQCKRCQFITEYASCRLREYDDTEGACPLENISCRSCQYCCDIRTKTGELIENAYYCYLNDELKDDDSTACSEYT